MTLASFISTPLFICIHSSFLSITFSHFLTRYQTSLVLLTLFSFTRLSYCLYLSSLSLFYTKHGQTPALYISKNVLQLFIYLKQFQVGN